MSKLMVKGIEITAPGDVNVVDFEIDRPGPLQVLVRIVEGGICGGEVDQYLGIQTKYLPNIIGHESVGIVEEVGFLVQGFKPGDRVIGQFRQGRALATAVVADAANLFHAPDDLVTAVLAEPLMCCLWTLERQQVVFGQHMAFVGLGAMNAITMEIAKALYPASITVIARSDTTLERAVELGATHVFNPSKDLPARLEKEFGQLPDVVVESTGNAEGLQTSIDAVRPGGMLIWQGYQQGAKRPVDLETVAIKGVATVNAHCFPMPEVSRPRFQRGMQMLTTGGLKLDHVISHHFDGLENAAEAFRVASDRVVERPMKVVLRIAE
jgi:threonine dehydrogenase-like Zn-dependent dehydrogenase